MSAAPLSLGTAQLGLPYGVANRRGLPSIAEAEALLDAAADSGVRALDTAAVYGSSEERIGAWLRRRGSAHVFEICSKLPPLGTLPRGESIDRVVATAVESSLRKLGVERLDGYLVHRAEDLRLHGRALVDALEAQHRLGRIGRVGVSAYNPEQAATVSELPAGSIVQHPFNLLDRRLVESGALGRLREHDVRIHARSAFLQGLLTLSPDALPERVAHARPYLVELSELLAERELTPADAALAFAASGEVDRVVVGVDTPAQLHANLAAMERPLPENLLEALSARLGRVPAEVVEPPRWGEESS